MRRHGRLLHLDEAKIERVHGYFARHGGKTVFTGRFIALLRTWAAFFAGAGRMPYRRFMLYNAAGGIVWAGLFGTLGYLFGQHLPALEHAVGRLGLVLLGAAVLGGGSLLLWRRRHTPSRGSRS